MHLNIFGYKTFSSYEEACHYYEMGHMYLWSWVRLSFHASNYYITSIFILFI